MGPAAVQGKFVDFAHRLADAAGAVIRPYFRSPIAVDDKGTGRAGYDPVTIADQEAEAVIRQMILKEHPDHGILGEEHGAQAGTSEWTWVIDPIDGTRAFITGFPVWGTLIALNDGKRPVLGVIDQPVLRERYIGDGKNAEAIVAGERRPLRTRDCHALAAAVVTTTHPTGYFSLAEQQAFRSVADRARMSRFGGDCYAYAMLAMGLVDAVIEASLKPYDIQALIPIVEGAGGRVTDWKGGDAQQGGRIVATGDARVHAEILETLSALPD